MTTPTDVSELTYEQARDELVAIVTQLEAGTESLDQAMKLWERGEALATHCEDFLDAAQTRLQAVKGTSGPAAEAVASDGGGAR